MDIITRLCNDMAARQASDLFLTSGRCAYMRISGHLLEDTASGVISAEQMQQFTESAFPPGTWQQLLDNKDLDLGLSLPDIGRFRVNLSLQRGETAMAIRRIPSGAIDHRALLIPDQVIEMANESRGLILITGATGSGKSTTLAALLHHINTTFQKHIVTIEDPIEYAHDDIKSLISQREVGDDTNDFHTALKAVVRQNPDAIFIGEIRDRQTLETSISAALTGHLVATTMHTMDVPQTVERILNYFPEEYREQAAHDLAQTLIGIVSQRLVPKKNGTGRVVALEFLRVTPLARRLIANREISSLPDIIKAGADQGMITFDRCVYERYQEGLIDLDSAMQAASSREVLQLMLQGMETGVDTFRSYSADPEQGISIKKLLKDAIHYHASDLLLTAGSPPAVRLDGAIRPFDMPPLSPADTRKLLYSVLSYAQRADFEQDREIDFALAIHDDAVTAENQHIRFRVNGFFQKGAVAAAFRLIPTRIPSPEELGLPQSVIGLCARNQGLVLITGPTGSGKSTTLAALLDRINSTRPCHIITVEDPIEFVHHHKQALIEQREIHADTLSFANALKYVLRQDPDIILIGEMRDPETISTALTAAETGHLVFATLHTNDVTQSVDRIIDVFPADRQNQVRSQLAACLEAVVSQRLYKRADIPTGRIAAFEVLMGTVAVKALIRDKKTHQLLATIESSAQDGMISMERAMKNLLQQGKVSPQDYMNSIPRTSTVFLQ